MSVTPEQSTRGKRNLLVMLPLVAFLALAGLFLYRLGSGDPSKLPSALIGRQAPAIDLPALEGLTIWLAATFFATGILRLIQAFHHRVFREWFWLLLSSVMSIFIGFLIMQGWPSTSLWVPGMLMAVEFLLQGWTLHFLGLAAKSASE